MSNKLNILDAFPTWESRTVKSENHNHKPSWKRFGKGYSEVRATLEVDGSLYIHTKEVATGDRCVTKDTFASMAPEKVAELAAIFQKAGVLAKLEMGGNCERFVAVHASPSYILDKQTGGHAPHCPCPDCKGKGGA